MATSLLDLLPLDLRLRLMASGQIGGGQRGLPQGPLPMASGGGAAPAGATEPGYGKQPAFNYPGFTDIPPDSGDPNTGRPASSLPPGVQYAYENNYPTAAFVAANTRPGGFYTPEQQQALASRFGGQQGGPSTDDWRLLAPAYRDPSFMMRGGHIINKYLSDPAKYIQSRGGVGTGVFGPGGPGQGYPASTGSSNVRGYFWPGQIEPWRVEGATGTT